MPDGMSPVPDSSQPQGVGHYRAEDDIELPPLQESVTSNRGPSPVWTERIMPRGLGALVGIVALLGAVAIGGWFYLNGSAERQHENWQHVAAAARASNDTTQQLIALDSDGTQFESPAIEVSSSDANRSAMQQIRVALLRNDLISATAALQAAQTLPSPSANPEVKLPTIDNELAQAIKQGKKELYQIELFDCCHEDGDIIEVLVNGQSFATVPIMHQGNMVSIPLDRGNNTVTVRGVKDGGGGVTVSFRTSRGEYFARYMDVGEEHQMNVVVQ